MKETIGRNVNSSVGDFNLCVSEVSYILSGFMTQGCILAYCFLVKKVLFFKARKILLSFPSLSNVGFSDNFRNFDPLLTISYILDKNSVSLIWSCYQNAFIIS